MTPKQFNAARYSLRLTTSGRDHLSTGEFGSVLGCTSRQVRRYESGASQVPAHVELVIGLLLRQDEVGAVARQERQVEPAKVRPEPGEQGEGEEAE